MKDLSKIYEPHKHEEAVYKKWEASGFFNPDNLPGDRKKTYCIVLPPPNVTGKLHLGHASMLSYQDIMIRYHRLKGEKTLWLPGMDHAAIATQNVVEKELKQAGQSRHDLGREKFLQKVDEFVEKSKAIIRNQFKRMGSSLDWSRERFTLDEKLSLAVKTAFIKMYHDDLIYRGKRVVNWCPRCQSTLADDEVEYKEEPAPFYYFKYGPVVIGTARPETKFSDKVIIVHPQDKRYQAIIGKEFEVEWINGRIKAKVIADPAAEMSLGTGAMTITPAHSFIDYDLAQKYHLAVEEIIDKEGRLTDKAGEFAGQLAAEAREKIVAKLKAKGLVDHIDEKYIHNLSVCYRCGTAVEPLLSEQWFVDVNKKVPGRGKSLKQLASEIVKDGKIAIIPDRFNKTYFQWMDNLRDWCISRQIWYGHRIPVWYKNGITDKGEGIYVGMEVPQGNDWIQDEDTLDTWFSSGLWTFSTLGWPNQTQDLKNYHPTSVLETMYDILFFWVARMIIMSLYFLKEKPFEVVYLHAMVKDRAGRKMSKSLGNGIDPIAMIEKFGADALRLSMIIGATPGTDLRLYEKKIAGYRNFINKLWNISRYILSSVKEARFIKAEDLKPKTLSDQWIIYELNKIIESTTKNLEAFRFSQAGEDLYEFTWNKLADWYLEIAKIESSLAGESDKDEILLFILERLLVLWHPFCPYVTEVIWEQFGSGELIMVKAWPQATKQQSNKATKQDFSLIQDVVSIIRNARAEHKVEPKKIYTCSIRSAEQKLIEENNQVIEGLAKVRITPKSPGIQLHTTSADIVLDIKENQETKKSKDKKISNLVRYIQIQENKLKNKDFINKAPQAVIAAEEDKLSRAREQLSLLSD